MKKYLLVLLGLFVLTTTTYSQELTEKEKARQEKEARKQAKENAKKEAKLKKAAKKDAKIADLRADYEEFLAEWEPIEANIGIAEVDTFFIHTNELFALLQRVEENTAFIEMVPEPYFDEEMGVTDTIWNAKNKNTNEPIAKNDALKVYSIATLNLTEAAARGVSLTAESVSALASLTSDPLKALTIGKKVKQATKAIKMSVNVIPLIQRNIKENTEKLKYKKANEGQEVKEEYSLAMFEMLMALLTKSGFEHYEISNFCRPGKYSRHNTSYWKGIAYLGCGPSAHSFDGMTREWNVSSIDTYIKGIEEGCRAFETEYLDPTTRYNEFIITTIRTVWGTPIEKLKQMFGNEMWEYCQKMAAPYLKNGKLEEYNGALRLTREGIFISDSIMSDLLWVD